MLGVRDGGSSVAYLAERGHAVVYLDLGQSLQAQGEGRLLLPSLDVCY